MPRDIDTFLTIITTKLNKQELWPLLEAISSSLDYGACPLCGCEEFPVDAEGNEIEDSDVEDAHEWHSLHEPDCPVTIITSSFS